MKTKILPSNKEIELPKCFNEKIRDDISNKYYETEKRRQPYAPYFMAGRQHSASGKIRHNRRFWKTAYGKGISRVPRKILWRRGTQFYWIAAEIGSARGGRKIHPPTVAHFQKQKKINKKEKLLALYSAIAATASSVYVKRRYMRLEKEIHVPIVIESILLKTKTKEFANEMKKILNENYELAERGKKQVGVLIVIGNNEKLKTKLFDIRKVKELEIKDLMPLGRLTVYSENAIKELGEMEKKK